MRSYYFSILMGPCFIKLFHPSKFERVTAFPPISNPRFFLHTLYFWQFLALWGKNSHLGVISLLAYTLTFIFFQASFDIKV